jgi:pimeloyl-ACP methyl ester carboxylesterase
MRRAAIEVDGQSASYLTGGDGGPLVLLLHGTYWSRVWQPVLDELAAAGLRPVAVDFPGLGRSAGELTLADAAVPALAAWAERFLRAIGADGRVGVAGHDIGGAIAQHLLVKGTIKIDRLALVNSVMYDSWPVPGVARYRDPEVARATSVEELLAARRQSVTTAVARPITDAEITEYLDPWREPRVARSWLALAGAADSRHTLNLLRAMRASSTPKLLVWGEADPFQLIEYAERFAAEMPETALIRIRGAGHIPMEKEPKAVARALGDFFNGHSA